jgi:hypothetical protein
MSFELTLLDHPLRPVGGEGTADSALAEPSGAGSGAKARYPQTGDFITNVSARRGEVGCV